VHTWSCPACGRSVPLRVAACHCGLTQEQAQERAAAEEAAFLAAAAPAASPVEPPRGVSRRRVRSPYDFQWAALPGDVKALLVSAALVGLLGMGWLFFGPAPEPIVPVLGYVDAGPPPAPKPTPRPRPAFKLPWWK